MIKYLAAALAASTLATSAQAFSIAYDATGALPGYTTATVFEPFTTSAANGTPVVVGSPNGYSESVLPFSSANTYQGSVPGQAVAPPQAVGSFLSIQNGFFEINFGTPGVQFLSFLFGSLDSYNSVTLNFTNGTTQTLIGGQIIGQGINAGLGSAGRVSYDAQGSASISSVIFGSGQPAFEIDEIAAAVPEPAAWAMMVLGFGLIGWQLRGRRRSQGKTVLA